MNQDNAPGTARKPPVRWYQSYFLWVILGGVILVTCLAFLDSNILTNKRFLKLVCYNFDFRHWHIFYSVILWIVAAGVFCYTLIQISWIKNTILAKSHSDKTRVISLKTLEKRPYVVLLLTGIVLGTVFFFRYCSIEQIRRVLYYRVYLQLCSEPMIDLIYDGKFSWQVLILPVMILTAIVFLLRFRKRESP